MSSDCFFVRTSRRDGWSRGPDLNRGPADYESAALPTELPRRLLDCNIGAKKLSNFGREMCAARERPADAHRKCVAYGRLVSRGACARHVRCVLGRRILQREMGYISQATPTPISTNSANDQSAYLRPPARVRWDRHASATEIRSANSSIAPRWLSRSALLMKMNAPHITQLLNSALRL